MFGRLRVFAGRLSDIFDPFDYIKMIRIIEIGI